MIRNWSSPIFVLFSLLPLISSCFKAELEVVKIYSPTPASSSSSSPAQSGPRLNFVVFPGSVATAGLPFSPQPQVEILDSNGSRTNVSEEVRLEAYGDSACSNPVSGTTFVATPVNAASGLAVFSGVVDTKARPVYLKAKTATLSLCSGIVTVVPAGIFSGNSSFSVIPVSPASIEASDGTVPSKKAVVTLVLKDTYLNPIVGEVVHLVVAPALVSGDDFLSDCAATDSSGLSSCTFASKRALMRTLSLSGWTALNASVEVKAAASPRKLVFTGQPSTVAIAGEPLSTQPVVQVQDEFGNPAVGATDLITLSAKSDSICATAASGAAGLTANANPMNAVTNTGQASFAGVKYFKAETIYLKVEASGVTEGCSNSIRVDPGLFSKVVFGLPAADFDILIYDPFKLKLRTEDAFENSVKSQNFVLKAIEVGSNTACNIHDEQSAYLFLGNGVISPSLSSDSFTGEYLADLNLRVAKKIKLLATDSGQSFYNCSPQITVKHWMPLSSTGATPPGSLEYYSAIFGSWPSDGLGATVESGLLIWGGWRDGMIFQNNGYLYSFLNNQWRAIPSGAGLSARTEHSAAWTGSEMIVWGGWLGGINYANDGARYNPSSETWSSLPAVPVPFDGRRTHKAVMTHDQKMIVWGGYKFPNILNDGAVYDVGSQSWSLIPSSNVPPPRVDFSGVFDSVAQKFILFGGKDSSGNYLDKVEILSSAVSGGFSWDNPVSTSNVRSEHSAVFANWTSGGTNFNCVLVWGGYNGSYLYSGFRYCPQAGIFNAFTTVPPFTSKRKAHSAVWDPVTQKMIIWGGYNDSGPLKDGLVYEPATGSWTTIPSTLEGVPAARYGHSAFWDSERRLMIIFGGRKCSPQNTFCYEAQSVPANDGAVFRLDP